MFALPAHGIVPVPPGESDLLAQLDLLDDGWEPAYDRLTALACDLLTVPSAAVSIIDRGGNRQFFKSFRGLSDALAHARQTPLSQSLCNIVRETGSSLSIGDASKDARFRAHPAHTELGIHAYLGQPIHLPCGTPLGALCVLDMQPRAWSDSDVARLAALAGCVDDAIRRVSAAREAENERRKAVRAAAARDLFLAGLNHEVRTALNGVIGVSDALAELPLDDEARALLTEIIRSGENLHVLLETLLDHTDAATASETAERRQRLDEILANVIAVLRQARPSSAHRFNMTVTGGGEPITDVVACRLKQVVYGLLGTAVTLSPAGSSEIQVSVVSNREISIRLTLADDTQTDRDPCDPGPAVAFYQLRQLVLSAGGDVEIRTPSPHLTVVVAGLPLTDVERSLNALRHP